MITIITVYLLGLPANFEHTQNRKCWPLWPAGLLSSSGRRSWHPCDTIQPSNSQYNTEGGSSILRCTVASTQCCLSHTVHTLMTSAGPETGDVEILARCYCVMVLLYSLWIECRKQHCSWWTSCIISEEEEFWGGCIQECNVSFWSFYWHSNSNTNFHLSGILNFSKEQ